MTEDSQGMLMLHRTKVVKELIEPWIYSGRIVCANLYLASVGYTQKRWQRIGMEFIGVMKTAMNKTSNGVLCHELSCNQEVIGRVSF